MRTPKVHAPHLGKPRPVTATRANTGPIRLVIVDDRVGPRWLSVAAGITGVIAAVTFAVGIWTIS